jgi:hypothetical protein
MLSPAFDYASLPAIRLRSELRQNFVEGLRTVSDADGNVRYEVKDGVFKRLCRRAQQDVATNDDRTQKTEVRSQKAETESD